jgi:hypothetical protein
MAGVRMPIYSELEPTKLRQPAQYARTAKLKKTYYYEETTCDPRYEDPRE